MDELREQLEVGKQAERFRDFMLREPYFANLLERMRVMELQSISDLHPNEKDLFSVHKARMDFIPEILNAIDGDIHAGAEALARINGVLKEGGIL